LTLLTVTNDLRQLRIAVVHPFLISQGGGEKVIDALAALFPRAEFFTLMLNPASLSPVMRGRVIHSSFLDWGQRAWRYYQHLSPLYDMATVRHDLKGFDLVISSGGPGAKTVRIPAGVPHIHYCHSPVRYLWDQYDTWLGRLPKPLRPIFALTAGAQRRRDLAGAGRVDAFIANSDYIGARIRRYYGRDSVTVYPPVDISRTPPKTMARDYYLSVGRLVPGKRTELLVEACNRLGRRLLVAGGGPELEKLQALAGPTVEVLGRVSDERLEQLYAGARAFLFAADEDFGIATVEAQSHGLPAIAYAHGGSLEILREGDASGPGDAVFFNEQTPDAIVEAIERFERVESAFDREWIQARALRFDAAHFDDGMLRAVESVLESMNVPIRDL
jgi:glycosyltransferase involved in cell wall biosynthesis